MSELSRGLAGLPVGAMMAHRAWSLLRHLIGGWPNPRFILALALNVGDARRAEPARAARFV